MKKITIIGDSNACGEWKFNVPNVKTFRETINITNGALIETEFGIDTYLNNIGYSCYTLAIGGNSNISTLIDLEKSLLLRIPRNIGRFLYPNYIIWIITEPLRELGYLDNGYDCNEDITYQNKIKELFKLSNNINNLNGNLLDLSFQIAQNIYEKTKIPFIIVEGLSSTFDLENKYNFSIKTFKNWINEINGIDRPIISSIHVLDMASKLLIKKTQLIELENIIERYDEWITLIKNNENYPDDFHPSYIFHEKLGKNINDFIKEYEK